MEMNKVLDRNACAYKEIYEILKIFPSELVNKVPKDKIEFFYKNMDNNYKYNIVYEYDLYKCSGDTIIDKVKDYLNSIENIK